MQSWREFWDSDHAIYVSEAHKHAHQAILAADLAAHVTQDSVVLDYGCGETPLITGVKTLYVVEAAPQLLAKLQTRFGDKALAPESLATLPPAQFTHIFMVSVLQYLSLDEFETRLSEFSSLLAPQGALFLGDNIDPSTGMVQDAFSLLKMGAQHGFFVAACVGLVKTALSNYRHLRKNLGFTQLCESELREILARHGFKAERLTRNLGPHQHRYSLKVTKS